MSFPAWGLTMAAYKTQLPLDVYILEIFKSMFGAFIVRSSACTINDIFDRNMDAGVGQYTLCPLLSNAVSDIISRALSDTTFTQWPYFSLRRHNLFARSVCSWYRVLLRQSSRPSVSLIIARGMQLLTILVY